MPADVPISLDGWSWKKCDTNSDLIGGIKIAYKSKIKTPIFLALLKDEVFDKQEE